jgi:hypothetical protein
MPDDFTRGRALVVGISNYKFVAPLPLAACNDAADIAQLLCSSEFCGYRSAAVQVVPEEEATLSGLRSAIKQFTADCDRDETAIFFFSGHGARLTSLQQSGLCPIDCTPGDLDNSCLKEEELSSYIKSIKSERVLIVLDACHSAGASAIKSSAGGVSDSFGYFDKSLSALSNGSGRAILASSRSDETSGIGPGARNSIFTQCFLDGLKGGASKSEGIIRVFDLFEYVSKKVPSANPRQHPIFKCEIQNNFPIALDRGGTKSLIKSDLSNLAPETIANLASLLASLYPSGPSDQEIWARAGGDTSRLIGSSTGRANWFAAIRTLSKGGGGTDITVLRLLQTALEDHPRNHEISSLLATIDRSL